MVKAECNGIVTIVILLFMFVQSHNSQYIPKTYIVGDEFGWDPTINLEVWPRGKNFFAGDILEFKYDVQELRDVVVVNETGYATCTVEDGARKFDSGDDKIQLVFGDNFFICSVAEQCSAGLKMAINATAPPPA